MISRPVRTASVCGIALAITVTISACGRPSSSESSAPPSKAADHQSETPAEPHHDEPGVAQLSLEAMRRADIRVEAVRAVPAENVLLAPAELQPNADRVARVGPRVAGRIARVLASLGTTVKAGQALATIRSPQAVEARAALDSARAAENLASRTLARERDLFERKVSAQREVIEAEAALANAQATVRAAEARLDVMGFRSGDPTSAEPVVTVTSPIAGTVIERTAAVDAPVGPDSVLFTIADLSSLWLTVRVPENSAAAIRRGQPVTVAVGGLADPSVLGRIDYIAPMVTPETRTVDVRVQVPNRNGELRPGTSANARFDLPDRTPTSSGNLRVLVPRAAVQELNGQNVVFIPTGERQFKAQPVGLGSSYGGDVEVLSGVKAGDRIVVQGAFTLKGQATRGAGAEHD